MNLHKIETVVELVSCFFRLDPKNNYGSSERDSAEDIGSMERHITGSIHSSSTSIHRLQSTECSPHWHLCSPPSSSCSHSSHCSAHSFRTHAYGYVFHASLFRQWVWLSCLTIRTKFFDLLIMICSFFKLGTLFGCYLLITVFRS